jgi:hypothetical protein
MADSRRPDIGINQFHRLPHCSEDREHLDATATLSNCCWARAAITIPVAGKIRDRHADASQFVTFDDPL